MIAQDPLWLLGLIAALCVAAGLSLYASLAALALLGTAGLAMLPPKLAGLETPLVWIPLLLFYATEAALARADGIDLLADSAHSGIRPLGAGLLAAAAAAPLGADVQWLVAALGAVLALWVHTARSGLALLLRTSDRPRRAHTLATAAEGTAVLIPALAAAWAPFSLAAAALVVVAPLPLLPRLWNAGRARRRSTWAILSYPFHGRAWRGSDVLPRAFDRALRAALGPGARVHRVAPAVARQVPGVPVLAAGWLAFTSRGVYFLFRGLFRSRAVPVPPGHALSSRGRLFDTLLVENSQRARFLLPKNAPRPDTLPRQFTAQH